MSASGMYSFQAVGVLQSLNLVNDRVRLPSNVHFETRTRLAELLGLKVLSPTSPAYAIASKRCSHETTLTAVRASVSDSQTGNQKSGVCAQFIQNSRNLINTLHVAHILNLA